MINFIYVYEPFGYPFFEISVQMFHLLFSIVSCIFSLSWSFLHILFIFLCINICISWCISAFLFLLKKISYCCSLKMFICIVFYNLYCFIVHIQICTPSGISFGVLKTWGLRFIKLTFSPYCNPMSPLSLSWWLYL